MTLEEAAEIILKGDALEACEHCDGSGYETVERPEHEYMVGGDQVDTEFRVVPCRGCLGAMNYVREEYEQACHVVGKKLPWPEAMCKKPPL